MDNLIFLPYGALIALENAYLPDKNMWLSFVDYFFIWRAYLRWN
jgi:hypothetical protein